MEAWAILTPQLSSSVSTDPSACYAAAAVTRQDNLSGQKQSYKECVSKRSRSVNKSRANTAAGSGRNRDDKRRPESAAPEKRDGSDRGSIENGTHWDKHRIKGDGGDDLDMMVICDQDGGEYGNDVEQDHDHDNRDDVISHDENENNNGCDEVEDDDNDDDDDDDDEIIVFKPLFSQAGQHGSVPGSMNLNRASCHSDRPARDFYAENCGEQNSITSTIPFSNTPYGSQTPIAFAGLFGGSDAARHSSNSLKTLNDNMPCEANHVICFPQHHANIGAHPDNGLAFVPETHRRNELSCSLLSSGNVLPSSRGHVIGRLDPPALDCPPGFMSHPTADS